MGKSLRGRDLWLVTLGHAAPRATVAAGDPVVANLEADHVVGSQVALGMVERLAAADGRDAGSRSSWTAARSTSSPGSTPTAPSGSSRRPARDFRTNLRPIDRDRDGRSNEDGPDDLDGDGLITRMRVRDEQATLVADEKDPRLSARPTPPRASAPPSASSPRGSTTTATAWSTRTPPAAST